MTSDATGLAGVLAAHIRCYPPIVGRGPDWCAADGCEWRGQNHTAHVATAVLAWLTEQAQDEGVREAVTTAVRRGAHDVRRQDQSRNEARADDAVVAFIGAIGGQR